ncbi:MAG TPA: hypothetical protein VE591_05235 [Candidatus Acidoferrum sp.]|nr:hypothetical protein [Candidatus Acidoferrum sp.]
MKRVTAVALFAALTLPLAPALAGRAVGQPAPTGPAMPTATPIYIPMTPPPSLPPGSAAVPQPGLVASGPCANDQFQSYRTQPVPNQEYVMVCGVVTMVTGPGSFQLSADGTQPVTVQGKNLPVVHPFDQVAVQGQYHRENSGAEIIDVGNAGAVGPSNGAVTILSSSQQQ